MRARRHLGVELSNPMDSPLDDLLRPLYPILRNTVRWYFKLTSPDPSIIKSFFLEDHLRATPKSERTRLEFGIAPEALNKGGGKQGGRIRRTARPCLHEVKLWPSGRELWSLAVALWPGTLASSCGTLVGHSGL